MKLPRRLFFWSILPVSALLLAGCGYLPRKTLVLWTNRPELAACVEYFNARQTMFRLELVYRESPARDWEESGGTPDLLLDSGLNSPRRLENLLSLEDLFRKEKLSRADFYPGLLASGKPAERQLLLPLSFELPALLFRPQNLGAEAPGLAFPVEFVREQAGAYNRRKGDRFDRLGFSPRWNPDFLYDLAILNGVSFRQPASGDLVWNREALAESVQFARQWVQELNGGLEQDRRFTDRYLYESLENLLLEDRILFCPASPEDLDRLMVSGREALDFRWLASQGKIPVKEGLPYIGIPRGARNIRGARFFIEWFFQPDTQALLLKINRNKRLKVFGLLGGFSPLHEVTERVFPQTYPWLIGRIPPPEMLAFPSFTPDRWEDIRERAVFPWLAESIGAELTQDELAARIRELN